MPEPTLGDYWESIYRRRWIILLVMIVAVVFAWRLSDLIAPRYEAKAVFYVPQDIVGANAGPEAGIARMPGGVHELAETYITVLKAADTFRVIAERFDKEYAELFKDVGPHTGCCVRAPSGAIHIASSADPRARARHRATSDFAPCVSFAHLLRVPCRSPAAHAGRVVCTGT